MTTPIDKWSQVAPADVLADWLGVSRISVRDLTARGIIKKAGRLYDLRASVRAYAGSLRNILLGRGGEAAATTAATERARLAKEQADHIAIKNAVARGSLLDPAEVEREWSGVLRTIRAGMLAVPSRVGARLPHLTPHDIGEIDAEVRAALVELGNDG